MNELDWSQEQLWTEPRTQPEIVYHVTPKSLIPKQFDRRKQQTN
jgi:hypothetical protein